MTTFGYSLLAGVIGFFLGYMQAWANGKGRTMMTDAQWRSYMDSLALRAVRRRARK
jgi:hypothetical protein